MVAGINQTIQATTKPETGTVTMKERPQQSGLVHLALQIHFANSLFFKTELAEELPVVLMGRVKPSSYKTEKKTLQREPALQEKTLKNSSSTNQACRCFALAKIHAKASLLILTLAMVNVLVTCATVMLELSRVHVFTIFNFGITRLIVQERQPPRRGEND